MTESDRKMVVDIIEGAVHRLGKVSTRKAVTYILVWRCGESRDVQLEVDKLVSASNATKFRKLANEILEKLKR